MCWVLDTISRNVLILLSLPLPSLPLYLPPLSPFLSLSLPSFLLHSLLVSFSSLPITPSSRAFITKFMLGWKNRPFLFSYISFTLFAFPSASYWILFLLLHWLPSHFFPFVTKQHKLQLGINYSSNLHDCMFKFQLTQCFTRVRSGALIAYIIYIYIHAHM